MSSRVKHKIYNIGGVCNLEITSGYYGLCFVNEVWKWVEPQDKAITPSEDIHLDYYMLKCPIWSTWIESKTRKQAIVNVLNMMEAWVRLQ